MKYRGLASGLLALCLVGAASAQEVVKTVFARTLHVVVPGDVSSGGVAWAKSSLGLPSSWSGEAGGTRTEVAEESLRDPAAQQARLKEILPDVNLAPVKISGVQGWQGTSGDAVILGVPLATGFWIVLAKGPAAQAVTDSVCAERQTPAGYMPRVIPGGMNMVLPYNFSARRGRPGYELKFSGFEADLTLDQPESGKRFDLKKTMDDAVARFKENKAYTDVKVDRRKVPGNAGELAIIKFKEGGRAKERVSMMGVNKKGEGVLLHWTFDPANPLHREASNRMCNTFKTTDEMVVEGERFDCGSGFSFETPARMQFADKGDVSEWVGETGGMVVVARHVKSSKTGDPSGAAALFPDAVKAQMKDTPGFKSETVPYVVNGVDGLLVKTEWKNTWRWGLFLATRDGIYVLDVMSLNRAEVEQAIRSAQLTLPGGTASLSVYTFEGTGLKVWSIAGAERQSERNTGSYKLYEVITFTAAGEGIFQSIVHTLKDEDDLVGDLPGLTKQYAEGFKDTLKAKLKIVNQGWQSDSIGASYWMIFELENANLKLRCVMNTVASGKQIVVQNAMLVKDDPALRAGAHVILNSYRLSQP